MTEVLYIAMCGVVVAGFVLMARNPESVNRGRDRVGLPAQSARQMRAVALIGIAVGVGFLLLVLVSR